MNQLSIPVQIRPEEVMRKPLMGVKKQTLSNTYTASIKVNGKVLALGGFSTPEAAHAAYLQAKAKHHHGSIAAFSGGQA